MDLMQGCGRDIAKGEAVEAEIDDEEQKAALGEHVLSIIEGGNERREDVTTSIFDAVGRAKVAKRNLEDRKE